MHQPLTQVLYDGQCSFCQSQMRQLAARDTRHVLQLVDLHGVNLTQLHPALTREACLQELHAVTPAGAVLRGFDAFRHIWGQLPSTRWAAWLLYLPGAALIGRPVYRWVANRRLRLGSPCANGTCTIHPYHETKET